MVLGNLVRHLSDDIDYMNYKFVQYVQILLLFYLIKIVLCSKNQSTIKKERNPMIRFLYGNTVLINNIIFQLYV